MFSPPPADENNFSSTFICVSVSSVHFCTYKEKFISLYCRLSSVLDLDALITQQALREAITDSEVATAKQRHQLILDYIQVRNQHAADVVSLNEDPTGKTGPT